MSCDWHIRCVTCSETLHFEDANHMDDAMVALISHRDAVAALVPLMREQSTDVELRIGYRWSVDAAWFAKHAGHQLRPIDEYGRLLGQCREHVSCGECGNLHNCVLEYGHTGEHDRKSWMT